MPAGDYTLTDIGNYSVSGSALKVAVDAVNITAGAFISGSRLHIIPTGEGQVQVLEVEVE